MPDHPARRFGRLHRSRLDAVIDTNLKSLFFLCQAAAAYYRSGQARSSTSLPLELRAASACRATPPPERGPGITRLLATNGRRRINVNAIAPGYIGTANTRRSARTSSATARSWNAFRGRWGDPSDLGGAAVFLASPASIMSRALLAVDGGGWRVWAGSPASAIAPSARAPGRAAVQAPNSTSMERS